MSRKVNLCLGYVEGDVMFIADQKPRAGKHEHSPTLMELRTMCIPSI